MCPRDISPEIGASKASGKKATDFGQVFLMIEVNNYGSDYLRSEPVNAFDPSNFPALVSQNHPVQVAAAPNSASVGRSNYGETSPSFELLAV